ncbi:MAG: DUF3187 family protein [Gemmatimonadota bacterium]
MLPIPAKHPFAPTPSILTLLGLFTASLCATAGATAQEPSMGPLTSEDGAPIHRVGLTAPAEAADPVARGTVLWSFSLAYSNIFEQDSASTHVLMVDMERLISTTQVRVGLSERLEVGGRLTLESTGGGALDGFVTWWHTRIGAGNANREFFPEGLYRQRLQDGSGGTVIDVPPRTLHLEDVRLFGKWNLVGGEALPRALSVRTTVRIPMAPDEFVDERVDGGLSLLGRLSTSRWHGHTMLGVTTVRTRARLDDEIFRDRAYHGLVGIERSLGSSLAAVVQYQVSTALLQSFEHRELDGPSWNLVFGLAGRIGDTWRWNASFQEDLPPDTPAPDFTLGLHLSRTW